MKFLYVVEFDRPRAYKKFIKFHTVDWLLSWLEKTPGMEPVVWSHTPPDYTVCPGSSDPPEKLLNIFASENEVYTFFLLLRYFSLNINRLQSKIILGHMN